MSGYSSSLDIGMNEYPEVLFLSRRLIETIDFIKLLICDDAKNRPSGFETFL